MTYDTLRGIVNDDARFARYADNALSYTALHGAARGQCLHSFAEWAQHAYAVTAEVHDTCVVLYPNAARAAQPACIVVSLNMGQSNSPSADHVRSKAYALIQVFDAGADDAELAAAGPFPAHRVQTKGRVLLH